ncbi:MAG: TetR/AcrR family transcriptional regulator [Bacillota bacterium]|nr:TetR/AcrR family transcriptional regulator [Bacillota bacterium]
MSIELFSKKGFNSVSIRDLAKEVGIKQSSLYNHFKSKDEILEDIYEFFKAEAIKVFPQVENLDDTIKKYTPKEFFKQGKKLFIQYMLSTRMEKIWRILFIEQASDQRAANILLHESFKKSLSFMEKALEKMIEQGKITSINTRICAYEYIYPLNFMFFEYIISKSINADKNSLERQMDEHINYFCNIILEKKI